MCVIETYIKELLNERGINEQDKEELQYEIKDHLILLKNEYLKRGLSEQEAVKLAIKDFGDSNFIGNNIKRNLPSYNKYIDFTFREKVTCLLEMFLVYFLFIYLCVTLFNKNSDSIFFNIGMAIVVTLTSFIFINKKLNNEKNKLKNIILCNVQFFIIEKIFMSLFIIFALNIRGGANVSLIFELKSSYIFNWTYTVGFILSTLILMVVTKYIGNKVLHNIRNAYNYTITSAVLFIISILFMIMYSLIPNRFYILRKIIMSIVGSDITNVSKNVLFIIINNYLIIPNIGLLILIILCIKIIIHVKKKGIKSIL